MSAYALGSLFPPLGGSSQANVVCTHHLSNDEKQKGSSIGHFSLDNVLAMTPQNSAMEKQSEGRKSCSSSSTAEVGIAVKDASIDPVRLVKAVTTSTQSNKESCCSAHEEAIQFELSISFNGRTYSATRTLPRLVELRNDLIREVNSRRKRMRNNRMRWNTKMDNDDGDTVATVDEQEDEDDVEVIIPEIPECNTDNVAVANGKSVAGRGFAMLQALLGPYCPAIERWLQNVTDLVPPTSSPSLSNFLWEPVSGSTSSKQCERGSKMKASPSLECIAEDSDCEQDDESDCEE